MVPLQDDLVYRATKSGAAPVSHAEQMTGRVANQLSDGLTATGPNVEVVEHGFGPGLLSRSRGRELEHEAIAADYSVADWTTSRSGPDERTAAVHNEAALRVGAVRPGEIMQHR